RTSTRSCSVAETSLWSASASPRVSKPGPRLAEVAGARTRTLTRVVLSESESLLEASQEPLGRQRDRPAVEHDVVVRVDEDADHDEEQAGRPLHDRNEGTLALEEAQDRSQGQRGHEKGNPEAGRVRHQQSDSAADRLGGSRQRKDGAQDRAHAWCPPNRERHADDEGADVTGRLLAD